MDKGICERCKNLKTYRTGIDEYPPCTTLLYCSKNRWFDSQEDSQEDIKEDFWKDCTDFTENRQTKKLK